MSNYKKIRCPSCGNNETKFKVGKNKCVWYECYCRDNIYCSVIGRSVCGRYPDCAECYREGTSCGRNDVRICESNEKKYGGKCNDPIKCSYLNCSEDSFCNQNFYFHPILRKAIYCPECGNFDVDTSKEKNIWDFKCNNCGHEFSLRKKNNNP